MARSSARHAMPMEKHGLHSIQADGWKQSSSSEQGWAQGQGATPSVEGWACQHSPMHSTLPARLGVANVACPLTRLCRREGPVGPQGLVQAPGWETRL